MKFIHLTDLHLVQQPRTRLHGLDPSQRLSRCLDDIAQWHADAEFCVITGDLTDTGARQAYAWLQHRLHDFPVPVFLMLGNHDERANFLQVFVDHPRDSGGFIQHSHCTNGLHFLFLDTLKDGAGVHEGELCAIRLGWLRENLEQIGDAPACLFMHHPPFDIGIPYVDRIKLEQHKELAEILRGRSNIRHGFFGHVHRMTYVNWQGIGFTSLPSTNHQIPLLPERAGSNYSDEPLAYSIVEITDDQLTVHFDAWLNGPSRKIT